MRCILDHTEGCMFEGCRYFIKNYCVLTDIDRSGWPDKGARRKPVPVEDREEIIYHGIN